MKLPFRHGLVRYQTDISGNPTFLQKVNAGQNISLIVSPQPTIYTISHRNTDYLFQERITVSNAWGPFTAGQDYWLYFDLDILTGVRTFGHTLLQPITQATQPPSPAQDQHWFDTTERVMKVRQGNVWKEVLRVMACKYASGSVIQHQPIGTQVGLNIGTYAGYILFDDEENPIRRFTGGRKSQFIHSESILASQAAAGFVSFTFESALNVVETVENIPEFYLVTQMGGIGKIGVAKHTNVTKQAVGIVTESLSAGQFTSYATKGFISNEMWNFTKPANSPVFVGQFGEVTESVPQSGFLQQVGHIVNKSTIYLSISQPIFYENA